MASEKKRDLASPSSGQPTQSKRPCFPPNKLRQEVNKSERNLMLGSRLTEEDVYRVGSEVLGHVAAGLAKYCQSESSNGLESDLVPKSCSTEEDTRRVVREELERFTPHLVDLLEGRILKAIKVEVAGGHQSEDTSRRVKQAVALPNVHYPPLRRANANNDCFPERNLQLRFQTKLSTPVYTGDKLEGEGNTSISVALIDANTGHVITSGLESPIRLVVVPLAGNFNNDDEDDWAQEEFEKHVVKERDGKRKLLTGDLQVRLKEGVAKLGELTINDNSNRCGTFRIGVKVASDCCQNIRIREGKTNAFRVKEHRGEEFEKHYPPGLEDDVWRLDVIAKTGEYCKRLRKEGIHKVKDFLLQLFADSEKLTKILGMGITSKNWSRLVNHAMTCKTNWEPCLYYRDGTGERGAIFNYDRKLIGIIKDRVYVATHRLSDEEKEHGDEIMEKAFHNWKDVRELNGEIFSDSMQKKSSSSFPSQVPGGQIDSVTLVRPNLDPGTHVAPTGERRNGVTLALPVRSKVANLVNALEYSVDHTLHPAGHQPISTDGSEVLFSPGDKRNANVELPILPHDINPQGALPSQMIGSSSQMVDGNVPFSEPHHASVPSFQSSSAFRPLEDDCMMAGSQSTVSDGDAMEAWFAEFLTTDDAM